MNGTVNINKCPKCGASQVQYDANKQRFVCNYCHTEFIQEKAKQENISELKGYNISDGSKALIKDSDLIVVRCSNCGAEVVINVNDTNSLKCHWCHSVLSIQSKVGNGAVPDLILPFKLTKEEAKVKINDFIKERSFFAKKSFKQEFSVDNVIGVFFPYLIVDCHAHAIFKGEGDRLLRTIHGDEHVSYEVEINNIEREFDIDIDDFEIEASLDKVNKYQGKDTKNVINSIMPYDTENCIEFNSSYLLGFTSEKRDLNVIDLQEKIDKSLQDIARHKIKDDLSRYDCGVRWKQESFESKGKMIKTAYLPVWLYSYRDKKNRIHYIVVNARTGEINGSIPMNKLLYYILFLISLLLVVVIPLLLFKTFIPSFYREFMKLNIAVLSVFSFILNVNLFYHTGRKYRNMTSRHSYETETKSTIDNIIRKEEFVKTVIRSYDKMYYTNTDKIEGDFIVEDEDI